MEIRNPFPRFPCLYQLFLVIISWYTFEMLVITTRITQTLYHRYYYEVVLTKTFFHTIHSTPLQPFESCSLLPCSFFILHHSKPYKFTTIFTYFYYLLTYLLLLTYYYLLLFTKYYIVYKYIVIYIYIYIYISPIGVPYRNIEK